MKKVVRKRLDVAIAHVQLGQVVSHIWDLFQVFVSTQIHSFQVVMKKVVRKRLDVIIVEDDFPQVR